MQFLIPLLFTGVVLYFLLPVFMFGIAAIILLIIGYKLLNFGKKVYRNQIRLYSLGGTKVCPNCSKEIYKYATKCFYCEADQEELDLTKFYKYPDVAFISVMVKMFKLDGRISEKEATFISHTLDDFMGYANFNNLGNPEAEKHGLRSVYKRIIEIEKDNLDNLEFILGGFDLLNFQEKMAYLSILVKASNIDEEASEIKIEFLRRVATILKIPDIFFNMLFNSYSYTGGSSSDLGEDDAYKVLGCSKEDSNDVIKKRYRELAREYHPDIIASQNLPPEAEKEAKEKMQLINNAYEQIRKIRGF